MDTETDEQVFIKSPHLEIVAPWLAYRREGVYYFAYHEAYADVAFIALLEQEEMMLYSYRGKHIKRAPKREYYIPGQKPPNDFRRLGGLALSKAKQGQKMIG